MKIIFVRYTKEEANYLINFYKHKIIGEYLDDKKKYKISKVKMVPLYKEKDFYFVEAHSYPLFSLNVYIADVSSVAQKLGLPSPKEVLNQQVQLNSPVSFIYV